MASGWNFVDLDLGGDDGPHGIEDALRAKGEALYAKLVGRAVKAEEEEEQRKQVTGKQNIEVVRPGPY